MYQTLAHFRHLLADVQFSGITDGIDGGDRVFLILTGIGALVLVVWFILTLIDKIHQRNAEMELKRDLVARGMSVDEIERVVSVRPPKDKKLAETQPYSK
jgi:hypothetical protein